MSRDMMEITSISGNVKYEITMLQMSYIRYAVLLSAQDEFKQFVLYNFI